MVFEQEFFPEDMLLAENLPYTVEQDPEDEHRFIIEGPKIEKCSATPIWIPRKVLLSSSGS